MSTEHDALIGKQLGDYQIQSSLGEGGMARVYKAYHPRLRREVAIKVILSQIAAREGFQARFEREAQVVASLEHPNIVSVYDFKEENRLTYLVMQYVGGGTLRDQLRSQRPIQPTRAVNYAIQMARALHHAHQRGIVHRDVKPQNMLISSVDPNHLLLSDFGIAKLYGGNEDSAIAEMPTRVVEGDPGLTNVNQIVGTADYMAPEQITAQPVDARTDVYALGVVLHQMLTGEVPFHATSLNGLLFQHVYNAPPSVRAKNPQIPEILAEITAKALAKDAKDRFQSAEIMAQALEYANMHATNPLGSLNMSNLTTLAYPSAGSASSFTPSQTTNPPQSWPNTHAQSRQDSYATLDERTRASSRITHPSGIAQPFTNTTSETSAPILYPGQSPRKRSWPLSYLMLAAVLIISIVVFGAHYIPGLSGNTSGGSTHTGQATAFIENFQSNDQGWQTGNQSNGVTATQPSGGQYSVTVPKDQTTFPYPQNMGTLPDAFTMTANIQAPTSPTDLFYGIAFHFSQDSNGISGYALLMNNSGVCQIYKYAHATSTPAPNATCNYRTLGQSHHTLKVQAQGSNYSFFIDGVAIQFPTNSNPSNAIWSDSDLHGGQLALEFVGPNSQADPQQQQATYVATQVQLSIP